MFVNNVYKKKLFGSNTTGNSANYDKMYISGNINNFLERVRLKFWPPHFSPVCL